MLARMGRDAGVVAEPGEPGGRRWTLSGEAFQALLASLDPDPGRAGQEYESLRRRLIIFFLGRGCPDAEDSADETLDRLSRRIAEGTRIDDVRRFAHGVARRVQSEALRRERRQRRVQQDLLRKARTPSVSAIESEAGLECIRRCAQRLEAGDWKLIVEYYDGAGSELQDDRKELAARLGITPAALRLRAFRIRRSLEDCTRRCLGGIR
jgi:DNA-directed RNA polymerase specialized sigma24 family protein